LTAGKELTEDGVASFDPEGSTSLGSKKLHGAGQKEPALFSFSTWKTECQCRNVGRKISTLSSATMASPTRYKGRIFASSPLHNIWWGVFKWLEGIGMGEKKEK